MASQATLISMILVFSVACGGDQEAEDPVPAGPVAPEAWASEVCTAMSDWLDEAHSSERRLHWENPDPSSAEEAKETVLGFLDDILATTNDLVQRVEAAGIPDVEDGKAAADDLMSGAP